MRRAVAGGRDADVARANSTFTAPLARWQRLALDQAVPSSAKREEIKRLGTEFQRVEMERC